MNLPTELKVIELHGRDVEVKFFTDGQIAMMARYANMLKLTSVSATAKIDAIDKFMKVLQSIVVKDEDKLFVEELLIEGKLEIKDLMQVVEAFSAPDEEPARAVRRAKKTTGRAAGK